MTNLVVTSVTKYFCLNVYIISHTFVLSYLKWFIQPWKFSPHLFSLLLFLKVLFLLKPWVVLKFYELLLFLTFPCIMISGYGKCLLSDISISQTRTGVMVQGKPEWVLLSPTSVLVLKIMWSLIAQDLIHLNPYLLGLWHFPILVFVSSHQINYLTKVVLLHSSMLGPLNFHLNSFPHKILVKMYNQELSLIRSIIIS